MLVLASISESLVNATSHLVRDGGLPAVFVLMALSCACVPIPSEVVLLFAGFVAGDPTQSATHHHLTIAGIVIAAMAGSMLGSWVTYGVGRAGRMELIHRYGHFVHMGPAQIERSDLFFARYGDATVCFGRLLPVLRAFVSLPAGVSGMPILRFSVLTFVGSLPWIVGIALAGKAVGSSWTNIRTGFEYADYVILAVLVIGLGYLVWRRRRRAACAPSLPSGPDETVDVPH